MLLLIEVLLLAALAFGTHLWLKHEAQGPAPSFIAQDLTGEQVSLEQLLTEGPVIVRFWATWCPNCKREEGMINELASDARVLTVAIQSGDESDVATYLQEASLTMPTIVDAEGRIERDYGVVAVPTTFIIDSDGEIRFHLLGLTGEWGLRMRLWAARWL